MPGLLFFPRSFQLDGRHFFLEPIGMRVTGAKKARAERRDLETVGGGARGDIWTCVSSADEGNFGAPSMCVTGACPPSLGI